MNKIILSGIFAFLFGTSVSAATLIVDTGQLIGATDVDVNGILYDVSFLDGTCVSLFSGCDSQADLPFNLDDVDDARKALRDQVFLNVIAGDFDTDPELTRGCGVGDPNICRILTPFGLNLELTDVDTLAFRNNNILSDGSEFIGLAIGEDTTADVIATWAVWTPTAVPIPAAAWLFGSALLGLGIVKRKKA